MTTELKHFVTLGYVCIETPIKDGNGSTRTIDFRRPDSQFGGSKESYHWTAKPYLMEARRIAKRVIADLLKRR